jgi:hypothetical protein
MMALIFSFASYLTVDRRLTIRLFPTLLSLIDYTRPSIFFCSYDLSVVLDKRKPFFEENKEKTVYKFSAYFIFSWFFWYKCYDVSITYGIHSFLFYIKSIFSLVYCFHFIVFVFLTVSILSHIVRYAIFDMFLNYVLNKLIDFSKTQETIED